MSKTLAVATLVVIASAFTAARATAPIAGYRQKPTVPLDYAIFKSETPGKVRLEVYYQIFNKMLRFERDGSDYVSDYEVSIVVNDNKGNQADFFSSARKYRVPTMEQADSRFDYRVNQVNFDLEPGKYKVEFSLSDHKSDDVLRQDFSVKLKDFGNKGPQLSGLEFINNVRARGEQPSSFDKGKFLVVPSVSNTFGGDENPRLLFYTEIYQGREPVEQVLVETVVRHAVKGMVYRDSVYTVLEGPVAREIRDISLEGFLPGLYELHIYIKGHRNKKLDKIYKEFSLRWSYTAMLKYDYGKALNLLAYIAEKAELDSLKKLETYSDRLEGLNEFWRARDPAPETPENEVKSEFYRRVEVANLRFSYVNREGWRTDRGRIYIQYGEPDELDDYPVVPNRRPYQEWHYYRDGRYRRFTFVDENSDGDYRLIYPYDGLGLRPDF
ncbi:MAG: GWxTD domain-containing protein [candidate division Zixibacteria bacterium]|nr:GWxTD domain-containing protein [candidate division Zixibacteria bacterium]